MNTQPCDSQVCEECGGPFTPRPCNRDKQRFCSRRCVGRQWVRRKYQNDAEYREAKSARNAAYFASLTGMRYAKRQLDNRRANALHRRRQRSLGAQRPEGEKEA